MKFTNISLNKNLRMVIFTAILWLMFLQLFSDFIESVYFFALMTLSLNIYVLSVLFFLSSIFLLIDRKKIVRFWMIHLVNGIMIGARLFEPMFETFGRMLISGVGVGAFFILLPLLLRVQWKQERSTFGLLASIGLLIAVSTSILFRVMNSSIDISTYQGYQAIAWILAAIEVWLLITLFKDSTNESKTDVIEHTSNSSHKEEQSIDSSSPSSSQHPILAILGLFSAFFIIYFVLSATIVLTRWTEGSYLGITIGLIVILTATGLIGIFRPDLYYRVSQRDVLIVNGGFGIGLMGTILLNQVSFPSTIEAYPIVIEQPHFINWIFLGILMVSSPILFINVGKFITRLTHPKISNTTYALGFTFSGLYTLLAIFALIFTSVWGFVPPVSFWLRDKFWLVFFVVLLIMIGAVWSTTQKAKKSAISISVADLKRKYKNVFSPNSQKIALGLMSLVCISTIITSAILTPNPPSMNGKPESLKILTYNLQQGANDDALKNYDGQLGLIRQIDADIIGLQESSKIAGNSDVVLYFAEKLNMYSYFGPRGVTGTTGVALLSKYPIVEARTIYHFCEDVDKKQTATVEAKIQVGDTIITVYNTHTFGRMETKVQLVQDIIERCEDDQKVFFIGDFNFREGSAGYNVTISHFIDPWVEMWPSRVDDQNVNATRRIDFMFLTNDFTILDCRYEDWERIQSDHPAGWVQVTW